MAFFCFILVSATLFVRPAEIVPELLGVSIYEYLIITCFVLAIPEMLTFVFASRLDQRPITLCILGVFAVGVVSQLTGAQSGQVGDAAFYFFKILVFYTLLVSLVNTPARLRIYLTCLLCFCLVLCSITMLQYHGAIELPTLKAKLTDVHSDALSGEETKFDRLQGSGIFQDPNEFCVMMSIGIVLCLYMMARGFSVGAGPIALLLGSFPIGLFFYAITLTQSRGGLIAFLGGLGSVVWARYGWRKAVLLGCLGVPFLLVAVAGRQASISATDTAQQRIQLWSDWLYKFRTQPVLGEGMKIPELLSSDSSRQELREALKEDKQLAAHNSYLHAFGELGFVGGMLFLGAFFFALWGFFRLGNAEILDPSMRLAYPYMVGIFCAYATGLLSLSLCYGVPTYLMLGLAEIYMSVTPHRAATPAPRFNGAALLRLAGVSVGYLACVYVFVRIFVRWT